MAKTGLASGAFGGPKAQLRLGVDKLPSGKWQALAVETDDAGAVVYEARCPVLRDTAEEAEADVMQMAAALAAEGLLPNSAGSA